MNEQKEWSFYITSALKLRKIIMTTETDEIFTKITVNAENWQIGRPVILLNEKQIEQVNGGTRSKRSNGVSTDVFVDLFSETSLFSIIRWIILFKMHPGSSSPGASNPQKASRTSCVPYYIHHALNIVPPPISGYLALVSKLMPVMIKQPVIL